MQAPDDEMKIRFSLPVAEIQAFLIHQWQSILYGYGIECETISHSSNRLNSLNAIALALANDHSVRVKCSLTDFGMKKERDVYINIPYNNTSMYIYKRKWLATESNKSKLSYVYIFMNKTSREKQSESLASVQEESTRDGNLTERYIKKDNDNNGPTTTMTTTMMVVMVTATQKTVCQCKVFKVSTTRTSLSPLCIFKSHRQWRKKKCVWAKRLTINSIKWTNTANNERKQAKKKEQPSQHDGSTRENWAEYQSHVNDVRKLWFNSNHWSRSHRNAIIRLI